jgi:hypothetical protein
VDEVKTEGGAAVQGDANTQGGDLIGRDDQRQYDVRTEQREYDQRKDNRQYDQRRDQRNYEQRDDSRGGNVTFQQAPSFQSQDSGFLWRELRAVTTEIAFVREKLDDLPTRVGKLEIMPPPRPWSWVIVVILTVFVLTVVGSIALTVVTVREVQSLNVQLKDEMQQQADLEKEFRDISRRFEVLIYMTLPPKADVLREEPEPMPMPTPPTGTAP